LFDIKDDAEEVSKYMKARKTEGMLQVCDAMIREEKPISIEIPIHIKEVIKALS